MGARMAQEVTHHPDSPRVPPHGSRIRIAIERRYDETVSAQHKGHHTLRAAQKRLRIAGDMAHKLIIRSFRIQNIKPHFIGKLSGGISLRQMEFPIHGMVDALFDRIEIRLLEILHPHKQESSVKPICRAAEKRVFRVCTACILHGRRAQTFTDVLKAQCLRQRDPRRERLLRAHPPRVQQQDKHRHSERPPDADGVMYEKEQNQRAAGEHRQQRCGKRQLRRDTLSADLPPQLLLRTEYLTDTPLYFLK